MIETDYFLFHFSLAKTFNFSNALEIGFGSGVSASAYLAGCNGNLTSIDIEYKLTIPMDRLKFIEGESPNILSSNEVVRQAPYDYIYVDADKRKFHVYQDATAAYPLLASGGIMLFDDCSNVWAKDVNAAIDDFLKDHKDMIELKFKFGNPHGSRAFLKGGLK